MTRGERWDPCPQGLLQTMARRQRAARRRQSLEKLVLPVGLLGLVLAGSLWALRGDFAGSAERIDCAQAIGHFAAFHVDQLPPDVHAAVERHLEECPNCRQKYEVRFQQEAWGPVSLPTLVAQFSPAR